MNTNTSQGRVRSALGEHLVALLVVAVVVLGLLTALPARAAQTKGTASKAQERVNLPLVVASQLDDQPASPYNP